MVVTNNYVIAMVPIIAFYDALHVKEFFSCPFVVDEVKLPL